MRATAFEGLSSTNQLDLSGARLAEKRWTSALWSAARDVAGNDVPLEEILDLLLEAADAWKDGLETLDCEPMARPQLDVSIKKFQWSRSRTFLAALAPGASRPL